MKDRGSSLVTIGQLIQDTFRQAAASGIAWMMLVVTGICTVLCLSVTVSGDAKIYADDEPGYFLPPTPIRVFAPSVVVVLGSTGPLEAATLTAAASDRWLAAERARKEGVETVSGHMTLAFGAMPIPLARDRQDAVHFVELLLGSGIAGTLGVLLTLVWTAGFVPTFLEPHAASVLLAKPAARWQLLLAKYIGVLTFVACQVVLFVGLTWIALGVRTGVWDTAYLWCIPLLLMQFAIFYSFSVLLAVMTHSTVACVFGSVLFWMLAWGINFGAAWSHASSTPLPAFTLFLADAAYWISPKPIDANLIFFNALNAQGHLERDEAFKLLENWKAFSPAASILSSLGITGAFLALSAHELNSADY